VIGNGLFGPIVGFAAVCGVLAAIRIVQPANLGPCWMLMLGVTGTWLGFTHLVDRFAVVLIAPCAVVAAWTLTTHRRLQPIAHWAALFVVGVNLFTLVRLYAAPPMQNICEIRQTDGLEWFTEGHWPAHQHVPRLNEIAARGEKVLMVADARRFYLRGGIDYCVVFNRNPFAEAAATHSPAELLDWLKRRGYRYVFIHWVEMRRLRNSRYGFWKAVNEELFRRLAHAGLIWVEDYAAGPDKRVYGSLLSVGALH
jgi:hypothetical protein